MSDCLCEFPATCDGGGMLYCDGCGGDLCVCTCGGGMDCDGCADCLDESIDGADDGNEDEQP